MDTSEQYIEQCRKAVKIQDLWKWKKGDFYYFPPLKRVCVTEEDYIVPRHAVYKEESIWLPTQSQLQEMLLDRSLSYNGEPLINDIESVLILSHMFNDHWDNIDLRKWPHCFPKESIVSFEQLWLAFLYAQKYNKTWNGEEWEG